MTEQAAATEPVAPAAPDAPAPAAAAPAGVGAQLAAARAALGLSIEDVAQQLKFAPRQILALEADRYAELPAGAFARGMLRSYARVLKLDPAPLVAGLAAAVAMPDNTEAVVVATRRPIPITDSSRRTNLVYAGLSIAFLVVIAGVVFEWQRERAAPADMTFVAPVQAPAPPAAPVEALPAPSAAVLPAEPQRVEVASAPVVVPTPAVPAASTVTTPSAAPATPAPVPSAGPKGARHRIALRFERSSWVEIRNGDGRILFQQLNPAGTEQVVEGRAPFAVVIGNAQHVRLTYDDKPVDLSPHVKVEVARLTLE